MPANSSSKVSNVTMSASGGKVTSKSMSEPGTSSPRATEPNTWGSLAPILATAANTSARLACRSAEGRTRSACSKAFLAASDGALAPRSIAAIKGCFTPDISAS